MERLVGGMLGASGPGSSSAESPAASPDEFFAFLQQYVAMGGSLEPDAAPPELAPVLRALAEGSGGVGALREMLLAGDAADLAGASSAGSGGPPAGSGGRPGSRAAAPPPSDREEIFPSPGFVVKTSDDAGRKVFINVCSAEEVQTPSATKKGAGQSWSLPHIIGAPHMVQDKNGVPCTTFEVAFAVGDLMGDTEEHKRRWGQGLSFGFSFLVNDGDETTSQQGWAGYYPHAIVQGWNGGQKQPWKTGVLELLGLLAGLVSLGILASVTPGIGATFFAQQAIAGKDLRQACGDGGITPAITVGDQAAIGLHRAGDLTEVSALTLSNPIDQRMQGRPVGSIGIGRHQSSSKASRSPKARCTRCWNRVVSTRSNNKPANSNPTA